MQERTISLYNERDFNDKVSVTFQFIRENFKILFPALLVAAGPFFLLSGVFTGIYQNRLINIYDSTSFADVVVYQLVGVLFFYIGFLFLIATLYQYLLEYKEDKDNIADYMTIAKKSVKLIPKVVLGSFIGGICVVVAAFLFVFPGIYIYVVFSFLIWIMVYENKGIGDAMSRCFQLKKGKWWSTFGLLIVMTILQLIIGAIISLPAGIFTGAFIGYTSDSVALETINLVLNTVSTVFSSLFYVLVPLAVVFQYFNMVERKEGVGLANEIEEMAKRLNEIE